MGFVAIGGKHFPKKSINEDTFRKIAEYLGIEKADVDRLMAENPSTIFIHRGLKTGTTGGSGGGSDSSGAGSAGGGSRSE